MLGAILGHCRIVEKLGEGGVGVVYLAEDTKLRRNVAIKVLPEELTRDPDRRRRFIQEAHAAAALEHPHIAAIHGIDEHDGRTYVAMEYIRGRRHAPGLLINTAFVDGPARAAAAAGDLRRAITEYRQLLTPSRERRWTLFLEPRFVLELARLLERAGDHDAAKAAHARFLELWKDADSDLPELREARGR